MFGTSAQANLARGTVRNPCLLFRGLALSLDEIGSMGLSACIHVCHTWNQHSVRDCDWMVVH